jgi:hypothetical protein
VISDNELVIMAIELLPFEGSCPELPSKPVPAPEGLRGNLCGQVFSPGFSFPAVRCFLLTEKAAYFVRCVRWKHLRPHKKHYALNTEY